MIPEILIAMAISALILTVIARAFLQMRAISLSTQAHFEFTRKAVLMGRLLQSQLAESEISGACQSSDGNTLTFQPLIAPSSEGIRQWSQGLVVLAHQPAEKTMRGQRVALSQIEASYLVTEPTRLDEASLSRAAGAAGVPFFSWSDVRECRMELDPDSAYLSIRLKVEVTPFERKVDLLSVQTGVTLSRRERP